MNNIFFTVRVPYIPAQRVKIVGSLPDLGEWNYQKGLPLIFRDNVW
jgi:hypothetical protein